MALSYLLFWIQRIFPGGSGDYEVFVGVVTLRRGKKKVCFGGRRVWLKYGPFNVKVEMLLQLLRVHSNGGTSISQQHICHLNVKNTSLRDKAALYRVCQNRKKAEKHFPKIVQQQDVNQYFFFIIYSACIAYLSVSLYICRTYLFLSKSWSLSLKLEAISVKFFTAEKSESKREIRT